MVPDTVQTECKALYSEVRIRVNRLQNKNSSGSGQCGCRLRDGSSQLLAK